MISEDLRTIAYHFFVLIKRIMSSSIKVFDKLSDNVIEFESKEDFMKYYNNHKDEVDEQPTRGLNLKYHINGYKIGRKAGNVVLYPVRTQSKPVSNGKKEEAPVSTSVPVQEVAQQQSAPPLSQKSVMTIEEKLNNLNNRLKQVEQAINEIYDELDEKK